MALVVDNALAVAANTVPQRVAAMLLDDAVICPDFVFEVWKFHVPTELPPGIVLEAAVHRTVALQPRQPLTRPARQRRPRAAVAPEDRCPCKVPA